MSRTKKTEQEAFQQEAQRWVKKRTKELGIDYQELKAGEISLSTQVIEYATPLLKEFYWTDDEDFDVIIKAAIAFWNFSIQEDVSPGSERRCEAENALMRLLHRQPFMLHEAEALNLIEEMEKRWQICFKPDRRLVVEHKFYMRGNGAHLAVIGNDISRQMKNHADTELH